MDWSVQVREWGRVVPFGEGEARWGISWLWQRNARYGAEKAMHSKSKQCSGIAKCGYVKERLRFVM